MVESLSDILNNKALINHNHDASYASFNHNHNSLYSAINHTHDISEITRTSINEEEEETTESLSDILDGKADTVHTHTSADITNWATATENFAKLNANNTFTGSNTFNKRLNINIIYQMEQ